MEYLALVQFDDGEWVVTFPDCPGCVTQVEGEDEIEAMAKEALEGWLKTHLLHGEAPPRPALHLRAPRGKRLVRVQVRLGLSMQLLLRWARQESGLTQAQVAKRVGVGQPQIAKLENPDSNPSVETLERVLTALGISVRLDWRPRTVERHLVPA
jgi:predicted RNase H-like HicB family nuclease/DNA-binding XRE family transcriptional regulator